VIQQGQVFKLAAKDADGQPLWAYRYRLEGQSSARPQVGGFASRAEAQKALRKALDRIGTKTRLSTQSRYSIRSSGRCTLGGRRTDTARTRLAAAIHAQSETYSPARGRSVDGVACSCHLDRQRKELISRNFLKPSNGLEPLTPSLPCRCGRNWWRPSATVRK
jgi:hypothetical protein